MSNIPQASVLPEMLTIHGIGRTIVALSAERDRQDEVVLKAADAAPGSPAAERCSHAEAAMRVLFWQEDALVNLGLALVPETLADAAAQLALVDRRIDEALAGDELIEDFRMIARACLHAVRASLPVISAAAGVSLDEVSPSGSGLSRLERMETSGG